MKKIGKNTKLYLIGMIIGGITLGITTVIADTIINSTSVAYKTTTVKAALDELYDIADFKEEVKDMLYPVGSIYISVSSTNPSQLFGGTWVSFGMGRTLLGIGSINENNFTGYGTVSVGDVNHQVVEVTGGEVWHHLTIAEMPNHNHEQGDWTWVVSKSFNSGGSNMASSTNNNGNAEYYLNSKNSQRVYSSSVGGGSGHNNMQPYITVYMWKRTA